ncbi:60S ribosomal protein L7a [Dendrobium catenatum]|uniref:60S ribosomal protein L7a n=1 Tax=Dendrobium catenatum TaxID=906689 RepID=A0A2I0W7D7_9ASPA|nr:60S ribosomal protein L7a [Dendrobium catenatum]
MPEKNENSRNAQNGKAKNFLEAVLNSPASSQAVHETLILFVIAGALRPKRDIHRFVKWPKVVRIQWRRRVLKQRLKVPPAVNRFRKEFGQEPR